MNMQDLIANIAAEQGISKAKTRRVIGTLITQINTTLVDGGVFRVPGIGTFKTVYKNERVCRNPKNGEQVNVAAKFAPKLRFAANVRRAVADRPNTPPAAE